VDDETRAWRLLDANTEFLRAHSGLDVDVFLSPGHFEYAHEGWLRIRSNQCDPEQYREDEQDGRSHARSQLLWDFESLLHHDGAGFDQPDGRDYAFIKRQTYEEASPEEVAALDELASLLAAQRFEKLPEFNWMTPSLRLEGRRTRPAQPCLQGDSERRGLGLAARRLVWSEQGVTRTGGRRTLGSASCRVKPAEQKRLPSHS
jgi:hypothetical protein